MLLSTRRKARIDGFDLDAEVAVQAHDHERREGLLRDFLRPPLSHDRPRYFPSPGGGVVILQLKKPWNDRTTHVELTPSAFLTRLASLVPRPRKNTSRYFGMLAANARGRKQLVRNTERRAARNELSPSRWRGFPRLRRVARGRSCGLRARVAAADHRAEPMRPVDASPSDRCTHFRPLTRSYEAPFASSEASRASAGA